MANRLLHFNGIHGATGEYPVVTLKARDVSRLVPEKSPRRRSRCAGSHCSTHAVITPGWARETDYLSESNSRQEPMSHSP